MGAALRDAPAAEIGVAAPLSGPQATLGRQLLDGVRAHATGVDILPVDTPCTAEGGQDAARQLQAAGVALAIGFLCTQSAEAALAPLSQAGIPTLLVGPRSARLTAERDRRGLLVWRLAPRPGAEAAAMAQLIAEDWADAPFGILDDGSITARNAADELRGQLARLGLEPALSETYRPAEDRQVTLARRIAQSGVSRLVALGTPADTAIILRDAAAQGLELAILGGENLLDEPGDIPLPDGVRAVAPQGFATMPADDAAERREGYALQGEAAGALARAALAQGDVAAALSTLDLATPLGQIRFDADGESGKPDYRVLTWRQGRFVPEDNGDGAL